MEGQLFSEMMRRYDYHGQLVIDRKDTTWTNSFIPTIKRKSMGKFQQTKRRRNSEFIKIVTTDDDDLFFSPETDLMPSKRSFPGVWVRESKLKSVELTARQSFYKPSTFAPSLGYASRVIDSSIFSKFKEQYATIKAHNIFTGFEPFPLSDQTRTVFDHGQYDSYTLSAACYAFAFNIFPEKPIVAYSFFKHFLEGNADLTEFYNINPMLAEKAELLCHFLRGTLTFDTNEKEELRATFHAFENICDMIRYYYKPCIDEKALAGKRAHLNLTSTRNMTPREFVQILRDRELFFEARNLEDHMRSVDLSRRSFVVVKFRDPVILVNQIEATIKWLAYEKLPEQIPEQVFLTYKLYMVPGARRKHMNKTYLFIEYYVWNRIVTCFALRNMVTSVPNMKIARQHPCCLYPTIFDDFYRGTWKQIANAMQCIAHLCLQRITRRQTVTKHIIGNIPEDIDITAIQLARKAFTECIDRYENPETMLKSVNDYFEKGGMSIFHVAQVCLSSRGLFGIREVARELLMTFIDEYEADPASLEWPIPTNIREFIKKLDTGTGRSTDEFIKCQKYQGEMYYPLPSGFHLRLMFFFSSKQFFPRQCESIQLMETVFERGEFTNSMRYDGQTKKAEWKNCYKYGLELKKKLKNSLHFADLKRTNTLGERKFAETWDQAHNIISQQALDFIRIAEELSIRKTSARNFQLEECVYPRLFHGQIYSLTHDEFPIEIEVEKHKLVPSYARSMFPLISLTFFNGLVGPFSNSSVYILDAIVCQPIDLCKVNQNSFLSAIQ